MARALHLAARPEGTPKDSDFEARERAAAPLEDGQFRVAVKYLSIDPAMRVWMSEAKSYWPPVPLGEVMRAQGIGEIVESKNPKFPVGQWVSAMTGVQDEYIGDGKGAHAFDARRLPHPGWALSAFGATGMTAYFGLTDIGQAKAGEVLVVSAAAGAVGSSAVQIGKALGMTVVGIAGGATEWNFFTTPYESTITNTYWGTIEDLHEVVAMYRAGQIEPDVERFALSDALEAYRKLEAGELSGRAVVVPTL
jgi:NADPH-dependent curcumin reductase CurA